MPSSILFITTMAGSAWGGSEELWARTAVRLKRSGHRVGAVVRCWSPEPKQVSELRTEGVEIFSADYPNLREKIEKVFGKFSTKKPISHWSKKHMEAARRFRPDLVVVSEGALLPPLDLIEGLQTENIPYITISHNGILGFPSEEIARRYRQGFENAKRIYFVSEGNLEMARKQTYSELANAMIVRNPSNLEGIPLIPWPSMQSGLRMASVGRLDPGHKGQDLLLEALSGPEWKDRDWHLTFYGEGPWAHGIKWLTQRYGLEDHIRLGGHVLPEQIWTENHVLVMASRNEGLPLVVIEAMMCARPVIATDIAGHKEVISDGETGFIAEAPTPLHIARALERCWSRRTNLMEMGQKANQDIRRLIPADPIGVFQNDIELILDAGSDRL